MVERARPCPTRSTVANILALAEFGGAGVEKMGGRVVKGLRGIVAVHEVEGLAKSTYSIYSTIAVQGNICTMPTDQFRNDNNIHAQQLEFWYTVEHYFLHLYRLVPPIAQPPTTAGQG